MSLTKVLLRAEVINVYKIYRNYMNKLKKNIWKVVNEAMGQVKKKQDVKDIINKDNKVTIDKMKVVNINMINEK